VRFGARRADEGRSHPHVCAPFGRVAGGQRNEARILHPAIGIGKPAAILCLQRPPLRRARQIEPLGALQSLARPKVVVKEKPSAQHPGRPQAIMVGQNEAQRPDHVRRRGEKNFPLDQ
jgi:hypothetical protein